MTIDLHTHSSFSDGTCTPTELVRLAKAGRLKALALTDHDTMAGVSEALAAGEQFGVEVVAGIELSVIHDEDSLHLLGYWPDPEYPQFKQALQRIQGARDERNQKIIDNLAGLDIPVSFSELQALAGPGETGRPHIARLLMNKGVVHSIDEAFIRFLRRGCPAYVSRFAFDACEAVSLVKAAGGLAVLAHPLSVQRDPESLRPLLDSLVAVGLDGLEAYYPTHSKSVIRHLNVLADQYGLLVTGGSDYHGDVRPNTALAGGKKLFVPGQLLDTMKERWANGVQICP